MSRSRARRRAPAVPSDTGAGHGAGLVSAGARAACCTDRSGRRKGASARTAQTPSKRAVAGGDKVHQAEGDRLEGGVACHLTGDVEHVIVVQCRGGGKKEGDGKALCQQVVNAAREVPAGRSGSFAHQDMRARFVARLAAGWACPLISKQRTGRARAPTAVRSAAGEPLAERKE